MKTQFFPLTEFLRLGRMNKTANAHPLIADSETSIFLDKKFRIIFELQVLNQESLRHEQTNSILDELFISRGLTIYCGPVNNVL